jgi:hypothetical protein
MDAKLARFKELIDYDPETGIFTWSKNVPTTGKGCNKRKAGMPAGQVRPDGYLDVRTEGMRVLGHRLAWAFMTGAWPDHIVDHRDTDPSNNRWLNLRRADPAQSAWNVGHKSVAASGVKGVTWHELAKKWDVRIRVAGRLFRERHTSLLDAAAAAIRLRREHHGEFANHQFAEAA